MSPEAQHSSRLTCVFSTRLQVASLPCWSQHTPPIRKEEEEWGGSRSHLYLKIISMHVLCGTNSQLTPNTSNLMPQPIQKMSIAILNALYKKKGQKPTAVARALRGGNPSLSRTECSTTNSRLASRPENWHPAQPLQMPGARHVRVCGPALASRLCPLSRQCPGQPSPRPAAPPRLTRLLLTPTGEHSLCVSSLPWDRDGGRSPRGGGLVPLEASSPAGLVGARTQNLWLSSPLSEDSLTPPPAPIRTHSCSRDTAECLP